MEENPETTQLEQTESAPVEIDVTTEQTLVEGQGQVAQEEAFFDYNNIKDKPELVAAYREMQRAFTKKTQVIAKERQKIELVNQFESDPIGTLQRVASQYGMHLTRAEAKQAIDSQEQNSQQWEPKTWDDVFARAKQEVMAEVLTKLDPVMGHLRETKAQSIEQQLNSIDPNWKLYEDEMRETLNSHPTLVNNIQLLYRMSVPDEIYQARAAKLVMQKVTGKTNAAKTLGKSQVARTAPAPDKALTFSEAVQMAKKQLLEQGG